ncbi:MAG: hypothetical protein J6S92_07765 [Oscillospiraceae bacterium]|nr:hypothetical protein [Oscillospiraceae bacterium]
MKKIRRKGKAEGSVLFTVVAVMMVMVVFLMSTLVLTTSANRRSYYTFYENQAQYAAQGVLDAISNSAYNDPNFHAWVTTLANPGDKGTIDVGVDSRSNIPLTRGSAITAEIERINQNYIWDADSATILRRGGWKITVTASVGQGRNASEYTMANYIYENPEVVVPTGATNDANWSVLGQLEVTPGNNTNNNNGKAVTNKAKAMFMGASGSASTNNNLLCLGPQTFGNRTLPAGRTKYANQTKVNFTNNQQTVGDGIFIGNFEANCAVPYIAQRAGEDVQFWGDFYAQNVFEVRSDISDIGDNKYPTEYRYIPYVYCDGMLKLNSDTGQEIGRGGNGKDQPVNLYLGSINGMPTNMTGDMYLFDPAANSEIKHSRGTHLTHFMKDNVQKTNASYKGYAGGDIICNNANLTMSDKLPEIGGDIIFTNPDGKLTLDLKEKTTIYGAILCAGDLEIKTNGQELLVAGGIYATASKTNISGNGKINNQQTTSLSTICDATTDAAVPNYDVPGVTVGDDGQAYQNRYQNSSTEAHFESLGGRGATGKDYDDLVSQLLSGNLGAQTGSEYYTTTNNSGYDFSMFPFCSRQDEIFDRYYRFDLAAATSDAASTNIDNDKLCQESKACGHEWGVQQKNYAVIENGVYKASSLWVPYTCPKGVSATENDQTNVRNGNSNSFIPLLETFGEAPLTSDQYINTADAFIEYGGIASKQKTLSSLDQKKVTIHSHTADGTSKSYDLGTVPVVDDSCILDVTANNQKTTVFVDPTQKHDSDHPLCILLTGSFMNDYLTIVVNNNSVYTANNSSPDYTKPQCYADLSASSDKPNFAGKTDVYIFFDTSLYCNKNFVLTTTGAYQMMTQDFNYDIISNPIYPGVLNADDTWSVNTTWKNLYNSTNNKDAFKFELVPNVVIYGEKNFDYNGRFQNGFCANAELIAPDSDFGSAISEKNVNTLDYREFTDSTKYNPYGNPWNKLNSQGIMTMGSMMIRDFKGYTNLPLCVFLGDLNRPGTTSSSEPTVTYSNQNHSSSGNATAGNSKDYFNNDHQGLR